ncbi:type I-B CRISPR-associated protein Cas8b1/Cst1 [Ectobacillus antri]|uniref:Type I-B CRISPR-associated protein Cas8b1/Cst1 n=1 Tax=Ectobacillus antri TaxID=2486280 RepID=A0ABT6H8J1_9BACI|nr:type I-B CRISPR-associated protein Cas8b1/Cst1 [Ectobacillus antri]MDG4656923.1 type I-B CRISPR-associated protein Cas8b1/Cst1 [Ectobacillus antri]MDG5755639.1 type I-B CRISPR-associated protein Cas8b1/Cst1 [Ectobacillus antri]
MMLNTIHLVADEWAIVQGMVGYYRILKHAGIKVQVTDEGIVFNPEHLENFEHYYFQYFLDKYSIAKRDEHILRSAFATLKNAYEQDDKNKMLQAKKRIDECIKRTAIDKVEKKYEETLATRELIDTGYQIRNQKTYTEYFSDLIDRYIVYLYDPEINTKLTLNYVKATVMNSYFGQTSFLNVSNNAKTLEQQKAIFRKDYIENVQVDLLLQALLQQATSEQEILNYLTDSSHFMASKLKRMFKKMNVQQIHQYVSSEINKCSFFEDQWAFKQYLDQHFSPLSMSSKALNFYWGGNNDLTIPISELAKLILFCAPAGASIAAGKSLFIQREGRFEQLIQANNIYEIGRQKDKPFDEILFDLVVEQQKKAEQAQDSFLILEYASDYLAKRTDLQYFHFTPGLCSFFKSDNHIDSFRRLHYTMRTQLVYSFLNYLDPKAIIHSTLREKLRNGYTSHDIVYACLLRHEFNILVKGEKSMGVSLEKGKKRIWSAFYAGVEVRNKCEEGKVRSVAYRLLNAVRANDKKMFLDTTMRLYMSIDSPLPTVFMSVLDESEIDFPSVANSFIAGFISKKEEQDND